MLLLLQHVHFHPKSFQFVLRTERDFQDFCKGSDAYMVFWYQWVSPLFHYFLIWLAHISQILQRVPVLKDCNFSPNFIKYLMNREERLLHCLHWRNVEHLRSIRKDSLFLSELSLPDNQKMQPQDSLPRKPSLHAHRLTWFSWMSVRWPNVAPPCITLI